MSQTKSKSTGIPIMAGLIKKLGQENYQELAQLFHSARAENIRTTIEKSEDKFEKRLLETKVELKDEITTVRIELKEEITSVRSELKGEISNLRTELKDEISNLRTELKGEISNLRDDVKTSQLSLAKWMITLWVTNTAVVMAGFTAIFFKQ